MKNWNRLFAGLAIFSGIAWFLAAVYNKHNDSPASFFALMWEGGTFWVALIFAVAWIKTTHLVSWEMRQAFAAERKREEEDWLKKCFANGYCFDYILGLAEDLEYELTPEELGSLFYVYVHNGDDDEFKALLEYMEEVFITD